MALLTSVPPQAYTRDTLVKALEWISDQPPAVREKAKSADLLVSYYLQARRQSAADLEAPISGEAFKADLKHLAEDLKQFEDPPPPPQLQPQPQPRIFSAPAPTPPPPPPTVAPGPVAVSWMVDPRSLQAARELQDKLNLSNEVEALRMLITLGAERARQVFP